MIYVIDNCDEYDDREIYFVEAPQSFEAWFETVLVPWQRVVLEKSDLKPWFKVHSLVCVATNARWPGDQKPLSVASYLAKNSFTSKVAADEGVPLAPYVNEAETVRR
jgi:hypothetical protein